MSLTYQLPTRLSCWKCGTLKMPVKERKLGKHYRAMLCVYCSNDWYEYLWSIAKEWAPPPKDET